MNQQNFIKILGLTLLVVAATVGIAFIVTPSPIDGGRFCLALLPVVFAELLLGGVVLILFAGIPGKIKKRSREN